MCALLPSTSRAQAYVFKTDRAKIRPLLHAARYRTALELRQKCALPNGETNGQREDGPHFSSKSVTVAPLRCAGFSAFDCTPPQGVILSTFKKFIKSVSRGFTMAPRVVLVLVTLVRAAAYVPMHTWSSERSCRTSRRLRCLVDELPVNPPVGLRCLSRQEVVDKLNAVPVFSIVNGAEQMVQTPDKESGELACRFYLEIDDAKAALQELRSNNPNAMIDVAVTPLGTAFALCEWQTPVEESLGAAGAEDIAADLDDEYLGDDDDDDDDDDFGDAGNVAEASIEVRLQAARAEMESVRGLLKKSPVPPLLRRRNVLQDPIPLFGSDQIRFQRPAGTTAAADAADEKEEESTMLPLFFRRSDLLVAWVASGGSIDSLPAVQVTDLRTIAWQMQFDRNQDWRPMLFVAPEPAIDFVKQQQQQQQQEQAAAAAAAAAPKLSAADVQGLIFGSDDAPVRARRS